MQVIKRRIKTVYIVSHSKAKEALQKITLQKCSPPDFFLNFNLVSKIIKFSAYGAMLILCLFSLH